MSLVANNENDLTTSLVNTEVPNTDSVLGSIATTQSLLFGYGNEVTGYINTASDQDWYRVTLVAGRTYNFLLRDTDSNAVLDTWMVLRNSAGTQIGYDDDSAYSTNSLYTYTATTSGTYYISAQSYAGGSSGGYTLSALESASTEVRTVTQAADFLINDFWNYYSGRSNHFAPTNTDITFNVTGLTAGAASLARLAFQTWADVSGLTFTEVTTADAEILIDDTVLGRAYGGATYNTAGISTSATINIGSDWNSGILTQDSYSFQTFIHEIGHTLGLGHAGTYNGTGTYSTDHNFINDSWQMTVMSYFDAAENTYINGTSRYVMTPQMADIYAIQLLYGAGTARATNTIYGFNSNAGSIYNFSGYTTAPALTIYDTGGIDTLNFSGYTQNQYINLNAGTYSNVGGYIGNIGIYLTSIIENAQGGTGNDTIIGNSADNLIIGDNGNDSLSGGGGNDTLWGGLGNDTIDGGGGLDVMSLFLGTAGANFNFAQSAVTVAGIGTDNYSNIEGVIGTGYNDTITGNNASNYMSGGSGNDILVGGEGGTFNALQGSVYRLYLATFDREPDLGGFNSWVSALNSGTSLTSAANGFVGSAEFQNTYGALNNSQFVTLLFNNVLHRAPDSGGLNYWTETLNNGASRASVLTGFSESAEFSGNTYYNTLGFVMTSPNTDCLGQAYRIYQATLGRAPDQGGFEYWSGALSSGTSLDAVAAGFVGSAEFQSNYGSLDNSQFVTLLFNNVLHRAPDSGGLNYWVGTLNGGASRTSVVLGFSQSPEFIGNTASALTSYISSLTWNDTLIGGIGNDTLYGGFGADVFVFNAADVGIDHVYGVQSIDDFQFNGFGYSSRSQVISHLTQVGHDVRFYDAAFSGTEVIFHDTTIAQLNQADVFVV